MSEAEKLIVGMVGKPITSKQAAAMIKHAPILPSEVDVRVRSGVLTFSFGSRGLKLIDFEPRTAIRPEAK